MHDAGFQGGGTPGGTMNAHIDIPRLRELLDGRLADLERMAGGPVSFEPLGRLKEGPDSTTKALIRAGQTRSRFLGVRIRGGRGAGGGRPVAVVVCSRPVSPGLMERGVVLAEQVRARIGEELGAAIIRPIGHGYADGRSYVVLPWYRAVPDWRLGRACWRLGLRRSLLGWLHAAAAAASAKGGGPEDPRESFDGVLAHLAAQEFLDHDERTAIDRARGRLAGGAWKARHSFDHNDLWHGNILLTGASARKRSGGPLPDGRVGGGGLLPFVIIDWAGANPYGYGVYDLVRLARSLKLSPAGLGRELARHAEALGCGVADTEGHLLAACGRLHRHLECFPEERFINTFRACRRTLMGALAASGGA
jgi:hypothetical protein